MSRQISRPPHASLASFIPVTYPELRDSVEETLLAGQRRVEQAKVRTYWETGRLIRAHLLVHAGRADYGAQVIPRLARDLGIVERTLYQCAQFAEFFPILSVRSEFTWGHYRLLCQVGDATQRNALAKEAAKRQLNCADLETRVRAINAAGVKGNLRLAENTAPRPSKLLEPRRGTPGLHPVVDRGGGLAVDLGFKLYRALAPEQAQRFGKADIVRFGDDSSVRRADGATKAELFTYGAVIRRVVDGDTVVIAIEVAPAVWLEEKLRLRGLDCPELSTPEGKVAKRFIDGLLPAGTAVIISTTKPDKYDRYLADVFAPAESGEPVFVNNALLENGHAERKDAWEFRDWGL